MTNALIKGSQTQIAQMKGETLAETFMNVRMVCIVDVSSSMNANDSSNNRTRYQAAKDELEHLQNQFPGEIYLIAFNDVVQLCPNGIPSTPAMSTDVAGVLQYLINNSLDAIGCKVVLISDGEPNDEVKALHVASKLRCKLDCIYVGREGGRGMYFLQKLANQCGGEYFKSKAPGLLGDGVAQLLLKG